jgi:ribonuclease III
MARAKPDLSALEERLGHAFRDRGLLAEALTHVSASADGRGHSQRLEFLGDKVLGLAVADLLFAAFPSASEGDLSRRLAELVRKEVCAEVAAAWDVGPHLNVAKAGSQGGLRKNRSVLADACEAIIGAVFLDAGYAVALSLVERSFAGRLAALVEPPTNPKALLQEWALARGLPTPVYALVGRSGPDHAPVFRLAARVEGLAEALGEGASKRTAEQAAAAALLRREGITAASSEGGASHE